MPCHHNHERKGEPCSCDYSDPGDNAALLTAGPPPKPHQMPKTNKNCQANGLKYHLPPETKANSNRNIELRSRNRRAEHRPVRPTQQAPQYRWRRKYQQNVEGQDIEVDGLILQQEGLPDHYIGNYLKKLRDIELVQVHRVAEPSGGASKLQPMKNRHKKIWVIEKSANARVQRRLATARKLGRGRPLARQKIRSNSQR